MLSYFLHIMRQKSGGSSFVCVQLLQTLNILFENIRNETSLCMYTYPRKYSLRLAIRLLSQSPRTMAVMCLSWTVAASFLDCCNSLYLILTRILYDFHRLPVE